MHTDEGTTSPEFGKTFLCKPTATTSLNLAFWCIRYSRVAVCSILLSSQISKADSHAQTASTFDPSSRRQKELLRQPEIEVGIGRNKLLARSECAYEPKEVTTP